MEHIMSVYIENKIQNNPVTLAKYLPTYDINLKYKSLRLLAKKSIKKIEFWMERSRQRRQLADLDDRMLEDIGYSQAEIQAEISKPFWK